MHFSRMNATKIKNDSYIASLQIYDEQIIFQHPDDKTPLSHNEIKVHLHIRMQIRPHTYSTLLSFNRGFLFHSPESHYNISTIYLLLAITVLMSSRNKMPLFKKFYR